MCWNVLGGLSLKRSLVFLLLLAAAVSVLKTLVKDKVAKQ